MIIEDGYFFDELLMKFKIVFFVKDKEIEIYCFCDNNMCKVEVVIVRELELIFEMMELVLKIDFRIEVIIFLRILSLKVLEDELKVYVRDILEIGLMLVIEFEKFISFVEF